ncbi:MAG: excinuclease ABC subunit UvrC [Desulfobacteraceae bacterium]
MAESLTEKYRNAPAGPGVYLMKDRNGTVIYVGKAMNIKKRLASYFVSDRHDPKTAILLKNVRDFETIVTCSDHEAYILESNLIKEHEPKYNVILKDGKNYPYLKINTNEDFPAIRVVRKVRRDGALYFGPYSSASSVRKTLKQIHRIFKLRKCGKNQFKNRSRPCLNYQIKACLGVCCNNVSREEYERVIRDVSLFLKGRTKEITARLKKDMQQEAAVHNFEKAAELRDSLMAVEKTLERQYVISYDLKDRDAVACAVDNSKAVVTVFFVRGGYLVDTGTYTFDVSGDSQAGVLSAFVSQYYERTQVVPGEILLSCPMENSDMAERALSGKKGKRVSINVPARGEKKRLVEMVERNAGERLEKIVSARAETESVLLGLKNLLGMESYPGRIECFDNSSIAGQNPVSAMVVFRNGAPEKDSYRKYIIRGGHGQDDYACMKEILERRFSETTKDREFPDLLLVDGGKGQLGIAERVLIELSLYGKFAIAGIAKKDSEKGEKQDKIYIPGRSNPLNTGLAEKVLHLLEQLRDEAHRSAVTFQRKRREKKGGQSFLDNVPNIGEKRKAVLLQHFKGISRIKEASVEEIASLPGMNARAARSLLDALEKQSCKTVKADDVKHNREQRGGV